jgi:circadian clock protein KaiB
MRRHPTFRFRLYVADSSQNSLQAVANLNAICNAHLAGHHEIEVIDVFRDPMLALADSVFMTPTLIKIGPNPPRRIVGTLSQTVTVLQTLGIGATAPS